MRQESIKLSLQEYENVAKSPDISVPIALSYGLDDRGFESRQGLGNFSLHCRVQIGSGAHPVFCTVGTRGPFPGGKEAGA